MQNSTNFFHQFFSVAILLFFATACAHSPLGRALDEGEPNYKYGYFCGKDHPRLISRTREGKMQELKNITPKDHIDQACAIHDSCYVLRGEDHYDCDALLVILIGQLDKSWRTGFHTDINRKCQALADDIRLYFTVYHISRNENGETYQGVHDTTWRVPAGTLLLPFEQLGNAKYGYPGEGEGCFAGTFQDGKYRYSYDTGWDYDMVNGILSGEAYFAPP